MIFGFLTKFWIDIEKSRAKKLTFHEEILILVFEVGFFWKNVEFVDFFKGFPYKRYREILRKNQQI